MYSTGGLIKGCVGWSALVVAGQLAGPCKPRKMNVRLHFTIITRFLSD